MLVHQNHKTCKLVVLSMSCAWKYMELLVVKMAAFRGWEIAEACTYFVERNPIH
jgi:hypothetical protein